MKKLLLILIVILISNESKVLCQIGNKPKNDFKIGIYSPKFMTNNNDCCDTNNYPDTSLYKYLNYSNGTTKKFPTSQLNVLSEDGFNIAINYGPNIYSSRPLYVSKLLQ